MQQQPLSDDLSRNDVYIEAFREQHINQAARVLTRSFLQLNPIWMKHKPSYEEIFPIMRGRIIPSLDQQFSFVLMKGDKVIGVSIQYEMLEYVSMPQMPTDLGLFKKLAIAGKELEKKIKLDGFSRGQAIYGLYGVIDPDYSSQGYSLKFWWNLFAIGKLAGWKYYYSRVSSEVSLKMLKKLGAEELASVEIKDGDDVQRLYMVRINLSKPFPSYSMLAAMMKKGPAKKQSVQAKPKL